MLIDQDCEKPWLIFASLQLLIDQVVLLAGKLGHTAGAKAMQPNSALTN